MTDDNVWLLLARFAGNPHIVSAAPYDHALQIPRTLPTFPEPLPPYLPRNARLPSTGVIPTRDPTSANAGRFSMSLRGMRRDLRRSGYRTQALVRAIESEVLHWLQTGGTVLAPDTSETTGTPYSGSGTPVGDTETVFEISRTPLQLIWSITGDAFARYIVHCCARYYDIVSFSQYLFISDMQSFSTAHSRQRSLGPALNLSPAAQRSISRSSCTGRSGHSSHDRCRLFISVGCRI